MRFKLEHLYFDKVTEHTELDMPNWLTDKENRWFFEQYVLTLKVGNSVKSDFHTITRVE